MLSFLTRVSKIFSRPLWSRSLLSFLLVTLHFFVLPAISLADSQLVSTLLRDARGSNVNLEELADQLLEAAKLNQAILEDPERLIIGIPNFATVLGERLKNTVESELFKGELVAAQQLVAFAPRLFGSTSRYSTEVKALLLTFEKVNELKKDRSLKEVAKLYRLLSSTSPGEALKQQSLEYIDAVLLENAATQGLETLRSLALLKRLKYEPKESSALELSLKRLDAKLNEREKSLTLARDIFADPLLSGYLREKSESVAPARALRKKIQTVNLFGALKGTDNAVFEKYLSKYRKDFPEVGSDFDRELIPKAVLAGKTALARQLVARLEKNGELSLSNKMEYYSEGLYAGGSLPIFFFFGLFAILSLLFFFVLGKIFPKFSWNTVSSQVDGSLKDRQRRKKEKAGIGYLSEVETEDGYSKLLAKFGLDDSATEADIKKAYRAMIKKHHPDAHGTDGSIKDENGLTDRTFEELKIAYDRLISMRGSYFGQ